MGVERSVTRWYVLRQMILSELAQLDAQFAQAMALVSSTDTTPVKDASAAVKIAELSQQLARTRMKLQVLGPCPKPMMG